VKQEEELAMTVFLWRRKMNEKVVLRVNGEDIEMNNFVKRIITSVNKAIVTSLKIEEKEIKTVEIKITL